MTDKETNSDTSKVYRHPTSIEEFEKVYREEYKRELESSYSWIKWCQEHADDYGVNFYQGLQSAIIFNNIKMGQLIRILKQEAPNADSRTIELAALRKDLENYRQKAIQEATRSGDLLSQNRQLGKELEEIRTAYDCLRQLVQAYQTTGDVDIDWEGFPEKCVSMCHEENLSLKAENRKLTERIQTILSEY